MSIGIPIKLLHEAEGHIVTLETTVGEVYRGKLVEAEDNMNVQLQNIQVTARDGRVTQSEQVFIRGSMIRFLILPDMLKNAPMFKPKPTGSRGMSAGGGKSALLRAKGGRLLEGKSTGYYAFFFRCCSWHRRSRRVQRRVWWPWGRQRWLRRSSLAHYQLPTLYHTIQ